MLSARNSQGAGGIVYLEALATGILHAPSRDTPPLVVLEGVACTILERPAIKKTAAKWGPSVMYTTHVSLTT